MTAFVYDIVYTIPLAMLLSVVMGKNMAAAMGCGIIIVLFYHMRTRGRIVVALVLAALLAGMLIVQREAVEKYLADALAIIGISVLSFVLSKLFAHYIKAKISAAMAGLAVLVIFLAKDHKPDRTAVVIMIFLIVVSILEFIQAGWKKEGDTDVKKHVALTVPFVLPIVAVLVFAKIPNRPYDWGFVKTLAQLARNGYEIVVSIIFPEKGWDGGDMMGFSDRAVIGGRVERSAYKELTVSMDSPGDKRMYLAGKTFDTFTGKNWEKKDDSKTDYRKIDIVETYAAVQKKGKEDAGQLVRNVGITVSYDALRTKHIFVPPKGIETDVRDCGISGGDPATAKSGRAKYKADYFRLNRESGSFSDILKEGAPISEEDWDKAKDALGKRFEEGCSYADYRAYLAEIHEKYAKDPMLTKRTKDLTDELLVGAASDYEKLERVEQFLEGYTYTRSPGPIPGKVTSESDFADWFLFEKKEGFCTHFATAFVLLARSQGIPARYVQGYSTLTTSTRFEVLSDRSHAWPEAYIEGVGWIVFEPTPGFRQTSGWTANNASTIHSTYEDRPGDSEAVPEDAVQKKDGRDLSVVLYALAFLIVFLVVDLIIQKIRYERMCDRDKVRTVCRKNMRMLKSLGFGIKKNETLSEYRNRLEGDVPQEVLYFIAPLERMIYADGIEEVQVLPQIEQCRRQCILFFRSRIFGRIRALVTRR